ncbi:protein of unknown function [Paraburkholderia dioscoreae]|uniref:Uncharacterized protein n=1 Tax=Paraburkholderia dioscoreae TaxID=2604047 RepID=A0A5Q4Z8L9_9BURK|nr:protein of unknown function [Paraburkholderia dioscoreae]
MHLASTLAGLFVAGGKPYLRASVGHQINLWDFFEEVGSTLIAFIQQEPIAAGQIAPKAPAHAGFRYVKPASNSTA